MKTSKLSIANTHRFKTSHPMKNIRKKEILPAVLESRYERMFAVNVWFV